MKYWQINTGSENHKNHMLKYNKTYIGLGLPGEIPKNSSDKEKKRYYKGRTSKLSTPYQFENFENKFQENDIIILYHNKVGCISYGFITGEIIIPNLGYELAPDWGKNEIQKDIQVKKWIKIPKPNSKFFKRKTLEEITENDFNTIINF